MAAGTWSTTLVSGDSTWPLVNAQPPTGPLVVDALEAVVK